MIPVGITKLPVKTLIAIGAALVALLAAGLYVAHLRGEAAKVPELTREIKQYEKSIAQYKLDIENTNAASQGYQDELERLRGVATSGPTPVVRMCKPARVPSQAAPGPGSDEGATRGGVLPPEPGPDIGPPLYADADRADGLSAQIRGLHVYIRNVCHAREAGT